ncbi:MAG TPA: TonB-dependent receptor [Steroidobacteraceae bacterium]|nr:TonB-dependent receptor [Steroidobacteraceae bacterium]
MPGTLRRTNAGVLSVVWALLLCAGGPTTLAAGADQSAEQPNSSQLETVTVTAQFVKESVQDTPLAITAVTGDSLQAQGITNVDQLQAPNVNITSGSNVLGPSSVIYIRGLGQYDTNFAYEPAVGVYIDDVYYGVLLGSDMTLLDLDRVEILRGPQGTNSGKDSLGGSVKLYSVLPTGSDRGYVEASTGDYNHVGVRGAYDFKLGDQLFLRVSGVTNHTDGYLALVDFACANPSEAGTLPNNSNGNTCKTGEEGGTDVSSVRATLRWTPSDALDISVRADKTVDRSENPGTTLYYANYPAAMLDGVPYDSRFVPKNNPYLSYANYLDPATGYTVSPNTSTDSYGVSGDIVWRATSNLDVRNIIAYRDLDSAYGYDGDNSPIDVNMAYVHSLYHQFTEELRLSGSVGQLLDWTLGGYYFDSEGRLQNRVLSPPLDFITNDPVHSTSKAGFGQAIVHLLPRLNLTLGVRYTDDDKTYHFSRLGPDGLPAFIVGSLDGANGNFSGSHTDYRINLDYRWNDSLMTYVQYSTGYEGGGINAKPFVVAQVVPYNPQTVNATEIGIKSDWFDHKARANLAAFYYDFKDIVLINQNGAQGFPLSAEPFNAGSADVKGVELELELRPITGLLLSASASYLDFHYTSLSPDAIASLVTLNNVPPFTPKEKYNVSAAYTIPLGSHGTLTPRVDWQYTSSVYTDPANANYDAVTTVDFLRLPAYGLANGRLTYDTTDDRWQAAVGVTNFTNKIYYTNGFGFATLGLDTRLIAPPREFTVSLKRSF